MATTAPLERSFHTTVWTGVTHCAGELALSEDEVDRLEISLCSSSTFFWSSARLARSSLYLLWMGSYKRKTLSNHSARQIISEPESNHSSIQVFPWMLQAARSQLWGHAHLSSIWARISWTLTTPLFPGAPNCFHRIPWNWHLLKQQRSNKKTYRPKFKISYHSVVVSVF